METGNEILSEIEQNLTILLENKTEQAKELWKNVLSQHPADIAMILSRLDDEDQYQFLIKLPPDLSSEVFEKLEEENQARLFPKLDTTIATKILQYMQADKITDFFEHLEDEDFKKNLQLLQKEQRNRVLSLLSFDPKSAGGIMNSEVLTLLKHFTIKKSISFLQRLQPKREHLQRVYVTDRHHVLVGYINLDELVLHKPETPLSKIIQENELAFNVHEDQERVAQQMRHYDLLSAPVVDEENHFLGIITADDVFDVITEEASEDLYKISGIAPVEQSYFQTPFWKLIWQRSPWLISLLILQSISSIIMRNYQGMLEANIILSMFLTMLIGTGGNAGNQSGALIIRGLTTKEIGRQNGLTALFREFRIAIIMGLILSIISMGRVLITPESDLLKAITISSSLFIIVVMSMIIGAFLPLLLERFNFDPAHSAAPFLATIVDIIGIIIYCFISSLFLG